jgi:hypothetical protein
MEMKMKHKHLIIFVLSLVLFLGLGLSMPAQDDAAQDKQAGKSHQTLKKLPAKLLKMFNLSKEQAANTTRGKKIKVFMIGLDTLKAFKRGDSTKKVLLDTKKMIYPIYVGGVLKTSLSIRKREGGWKNASFGGAVVHYFEPLRKKHAKANNINEGAYFVVRVPGLYLVFLGYYQKGELYLIPTHEHSSLKLNVGKASPAAEVYIKMQPLVDKFKNVLKRPKK